MGYMGFGMRKDSYNRKSKEGFGKIKEVYGDDPVRKTGEEYKPEGPVSFESHPSRNPYYKTRTYKILRAVFLIAALTIIYLAVASII